MVKETIKERAAANAAEPVFLGDEYTERDVGMVTWTSLSYGLMRCLMFSHLSKQVTPWIWPR